MFRKKKQQKKLKAQTKAKGKGRGRGRGQGRGQQKGRGKGRSRNAQVSAVQLPQVQESDSEVEKGDAVDEEMQVPAAGEVIEVDEEMQVPDVALPTGVLPPATPVSTTEATSTSVVPAVDATEATSTSVVPAMDAEHQLSAEPLLATENPVAEDLLAAGSRGLNLILPHLSALHMQLRLSFLRSLLHLSFLRSLLHLSFQGLCQQRSTKLLQCCRDWLRHSAHLPWILKLIGFPSSTRRHHLQMSGQSTSSIQCQCPKHLPTCLAGRMP